MADDSSQWDMQRLVSPSPIVNSEMSLVQELLFNVRLQFLYLIPIGRYIFF